MRLEEGKIKKYIITLRVCAPRKAISVFAKTKIGTRMMNGENGGVKPNTWKKGAIS